MQEPNLLSQNGSFGAESDITVSPQSVAAGYATSRDVDFINTLS